MARQMLDASGNEDMGRSMAKINDMFAEIYARLDAMSKPMVLPAEPVVAKVAAKPAVKA